jgi:hypothetical protein
MCVFAMILTLTGIQWLAGFKYWVCFLEIPKDRGIHVSSVYHLVYKIDK